MRNAILSTLAALILGTGTIRADVVARQHQVKHPVLIRNDRNSLLQLTIEGKDKAEFLHEVEVSLNGTNALNDIESLTLFWSGGSKANFGTKAQFGDPVLPAKTVRLRGNIRLNKGVNHFWLSCRLKPTAGLTNRVDATVTALKTDRGNYSCSDATPGINKRIGVAIRRPMDDGSHTYRIPAVATSIKGTLLCVYDVRRRARRDLQEDIDIGLIRSTDGGQTWQAQQIIMDMGEYGKLPQEQNGCSDPGIVVDPTTGEIFVAAVWTYGRPGTHQWNKGGSEAGFEIGKTAQFLMVSSKDDGKTWSKPDNLTRKLKKESWILFAPSPQQGIALKDGTLIMPSQGRDEKDRHFSNLMISKDHGRTWKLSAPASHGNTECQAVVLQNGDILLNCRSERPLKFRTLAVTSDLGKTWRPHPLNRKGLIEPNCNGSTFRFDYQLNGEKGSLLAFANPYSQKARVNHSIRISLDDGKTWSRRLLLDVGSGAGYPSLTRVDSEHLGIVYEGSQAHVVFEKIHVNELLSADD